MGGTEISILMVGMWFIDLFMSGDIDLAIDLFRYLGTYLRCFADCHFLADGL